jgi:hypothetical protein
LSAAIESTEDALKFLYGQQFGESHLRFRGQANSSWPVMPSIHRYSGFSRYQAVFYEDAVLGFKPIEPVPPLTHTTLDLEWLMLCQHYGVPTRMLDWTREILVALYFACESKEQWGSDGALFVCDQRDYPAFAAYDEHAMKVQDLAFVSTSIVNPRMRAQSGSFMIWGHAPLNKNTSESYDLDQYQREQGTKICWKKLTIPKGKKTQILGELKRIYSISEKNFLLNNNYLESKYGAKMKTVKDYSRTFILYLTDANKLGRTQKKRAEEFFKDTVAGENSFAGTENLTSCTALSNQSIPLSFWLD